MLHLVQHIRLPSLLHAGDIVQMDRPSRMRHSLPCPALPCRPAISQPVAAGQQGGAGRDGAGWGGSSVKRTGAEECDAGRE